MQSSLRPLVPPIISIASVSSNCRLSSSSLLSSLAVTVSTRSSSSSCRRIIPFLYPIHSTSASYVRTYVTATPVLRSSSPSSSSTSSTSSSLICTRTHNYSQWYIDTIYAADMIDTSPVKGCIILKPYGFSIWDNIKEYLDKEIKRHTKASNVYFPLLVPTSLLSREAEHVDGFAKECAVVTHHRLRTTTTTTAVDDNNTVSSVSASSSSLHLEPDPNAKLTEPLVIRPTSEALIWESFRRWITSYRDLPIIINQWVNVFRWELRTRPFLRTSEFLWQEGHTVHSNEKEAYQLSLTMLHLYQRLLQNYLAVPVIIGKKSSSEKFAGADETFTCEVLCQNGWALQSATSHYLGTHFSQAFKVMYTLPSSSTPVSPNNPVTKEYGYGTSWGSSTRLIGAVIQSHSDDIGLVLPPTIAPIQIVIVGIYGGGGNSKKMNSAAVITKDKKSVDKTDVLQYCEQIQKQLEPYFRVTVDNDLDTPPGSRYYTWERKGVPLRIEIGSKEVTDRTVSIKDRSGNNERYNYSSIDNDTLVKDIQSLLDKYQQYLYQRALQRTEQTINRSCRSYKELQEYATVQNQKYRTIDDDHHQQQADSGKYKENETDTVPSSTVPSNTSSSLSSSSSSPQPSNKKKTNNTNRNVSTYPDYTPAYQAFLVPWYDNADNEEKIKQETKYTLRCYPLDEQQYVKDKVCFYSGKPATHMALFARAY